ncbi:MAG: EDSAP-1 family PEP-CTERM protein [Pirellulaceae bacterium]
MKVKNFGLVRACCVVAAACVLATASSAQASIESYSNLNVFNFAFYNDAGGGTLGTQLTQGVEVQVDLATLSETASATANTASIPGGAFTTAFDSLDTLQAYDGAGPPPAENTFTNTAGGEPFARGDTDGSGRAIAGIGAATPTTAQTVAETQLLESIFNTDAAIASSSVSATAEFEVIVLEALDFVVDFDASLNMFSSLIPSPPASSTSAAASWSLTVTNEDGLIVFQWNPNGEVDGVILGGTEVADGFDMTQSITTVTNSSTTVTEALTDFRAFGSLDAGTYTFTVEHLTRADVQNLGVVPEPGSCIVWGLLALTAGAFYRRRRSK